MSSKLNLKLAAVAVLCLSAWVWAIDNPIGPVTTPQSGVSGGAGLTPNRQPGIYSSSGSISGNDIVTGNAAGFKSFRGVVPYGSPYYFQGRQNDTGVENFLRRSEGTGYETDRRPGSVQTYISPRQAVTGIRGNTPVNTQVYAQPQTGLKTQGYNQYGLVPLEEAQRLLNSQNTNARVQSIEPQIRNQRPLAITPTEREEFINQELQGKLQPTEQAARERLQREQFEKDLQTLKQQTQDIKEKLTEEPQQPDETQNSLSAQDLMNKLNNRNQNEIKAPSIFDEMQARADKARREALTKMAQEKAQPESKPQEEVAKAPEEQGATGFKTQPGELTPGETKAILGYSQTFAAKHGDKFNSLMKAAEDYLKNKQFYKAADAYSLAAVYQSTNPLPYAGKSHALFGAGEYMSSAYWLGRAIEVYPDYLRFKVDLLGMFGSDKDLIETRLAEISAWQERTGSGELLMLMAYVYYELDKYDQALMAVNSAKIKMPASRAVDTLDRVIHLAAEQHDVAPQQTNAPAKPDFAPEIKVPSPEEQSQPQAPQEPGQTQEPNQP